MNDPAIWFAGAVAIGFLLAAGLPAIPAAVGAVRSWNRPLRPRPTTRAAVVLLVLLAGSRARPGVAEVPPPAVRLEQITAAPPVLPHEPAVMTQYVVVEGDCLWRIARRALISASGAEPSSAEISRFWRRIYEVNRGVVGADPDLIHPGQRLEIPRR